MYKDQIEICHGTGLKGKPRKWKPYSARYLLYGFFFVVPALFIWYRVFVEEGRPSGWDLFTDIVLLALYLTAIGLSIYDYFRSNRDPLAETRITDPRKVVLDASGLQLETGDIVERFKWSELFRVLETPKAFIIHLDADQKIRIDKEKLAIDGNLGTMRTWVEQGSERYLKIL